MLKVGRDLAKVMLMEAVQAAKVKTALLGILVNDGSLSSDVLVTRCV